MDYGLSTMDSLKLKITGDAWQYREQTDLVCFHRKLSGESITLAQGMGVDQLTQGGAFSVSQSGIVAWRSGSTGSRQLIWFNRAGQQLDAIANPDTANAPDTVHRIDPAVLRKEIEAAGFRLDGESNALRKPSDDHRLMVMNPAVRGQTDQIIYRFRKPG